jgi:autotransporter-associated beta strand protein
MAFALLLLPWSPTYSQQAIYEPFNYPLDSSLSGGTGGAGWLAGSSWQVSNGNAVIVPGLTFSGTKNTLATSGNAVELTNAGNYPYDCIIGRQIAPTSAITSGTLWMSYLVYMPTVDNGGEFFGARVNSSASGWWNSAYFQAESKASGTTNPGISGFAAPSNPPTTVANNPISPNTVYLVVAEYQGLATYSGTGQIWVLNTSDLDALNFSNGGPTAANLTAHNVSTATVTGTYPTWLDASYFLQFSDNYYNGDTTGSMSVIFDELRAGPSVGNVLVLSNPSAGWLNDASGNWSSSANWDGVLPNAAGSQATFGSVITAPRTVTVDIPVTIGSLAFSSSIAYTLSGSQSVTLLANSGDATINVTAGSHTISAPLVLTGKTDVTVGSASTLTLGGVVSGTGGALNMYGPGTLVLTGNNTYGGGTAIFAGTLALGNGGSGGSLLGNVADNGTFSFNRAGSPSFAGNVSGSGGLVVNGPGVLSLTGSNTYTGGTTVSAGTLQGNATSLQGNIANNAAVVFNQTANGTYVGSTTGRGSLTKTGSAQLTLPQANSFASSGGIAINQGTLATPFGISQGGAGISVAGGATLAAGGQVNQAVSGVGTVTATAELIIGNAAQAGQFNQGGAPGSGGTLNIGSYATVILSADAAILGSQTNLAAGGSLTALNGAQLGNASSVDSTKVLTATGSATINANFVNNGVVNGPTGSGQELTFTQFVKGAGSTTGNVEYQASYHVGNSPDAVSVQNVLLDPTSTLIMEFADDTPGTGYDQLEVSGLATLNNGTLDLSMLNGHSLDPSHTYEIINGPTTGQFAQVTGLPNGWQVSYAADSVSLVSLVPEPGTLALLAAGLACLAGCGLRRRRRPVPEPVTRRQDVAPATLSLPPLCVSQACRRAA